MTTTPIIPAQDDAPLQNFSTCHIGIISRLHAFGELPALLEAAARAHKIASETLAFFKDAVYEHHSEEERELFPAVLASAVPGAEREQVQQMAQQLTAEHRRIEAAWEKLEPALKKVVKGQSYDLDTAAIADLVRNYLGHAKFEEEQFLPLAHTILGRNSNHMAALGLSLHIRHAPRFLAHI